MVPRVVGKTDPEQPPEDFGSIIATSLSTAISLPPKSQKQINLSFGLSRRYKSPF
jgi:hypothetical protein